MFFYIYFIILLKFFFQVFFSVLGSGLPKENKSETFSAPGISWIESGFVVVIVNI